MDFNELDLIGQQEDLQRRKAIVDALITQQSMPGQSLRDLTGTWFGRNLPADAQRQIEAYRADSQAYRQREQQQLGTELNDFTSRMNGAPARAPVSLGLNEQTGQPAPAYGPTLPAQAPNPREAVIRAMTSQLPEMQAMGKAAMSTMWKGAEWTPHVIGNQLVFADKQGNVKEGGTFNKADWGPVQEVGRDADGKALFGQRNAQTGEVKYTPHPLVSIDQKGQTEIQKEVIPVVKGARDAVMTAQGNLQAAERVMQLLDDPQVRTGFGASAINGIAAMGAKLGFNDQESVAKTQALATEMAAKTLSFTKQLTGAISDKEKPFLEQVAAGKIDFTPEVLQHVAGLAIQAGHNTVMNAMQQYESAKRVPGMENVEKLFPMPPVSWHMPQQGGQDHPAFKVDGNGRMQYDGGLLSPGKGVTPPPRMLNGRRVIPKAEFLKGADNAPN